MAETRKRRKPVDFADLRLWLTELEATPTLHVNGTAFPNVALTVDFGTPLVEQKVTPEQTAELVTRLRTATKSLFPDREGSIQVQSDPANGIWWAGIS